MIDNKLISNVRVLSENQKIVRLGALDSVVREDPSSQCEAAGNSRGRASTSLKHRGHDKAREVGGTEHSASWGRGEEFGLTVNTMVAAKYSAALNDPIMLLKRARSSWWWNNLLHKVEKP